MTSYLGTVKNTTTSFTILWIVIFLTWTILTFRYSLSAKNFALSAFYFVILLGWSLCSTSGRSWFSVVPFASNCIIFRIRKLELHAAFKKSCKVFSVFSCLNVFLYCFLNAWELCVWQFLAQMFPSNSAPWKSFLPPLMDTIISVCK